MGSIIRNFSLFTEFCLVVFIAFGLAIAGNCGWMISHWEHQITSSDVVQLKNDGMVVSVVYDVVILGIVLWIGRIRGWSLKTFGTRVTWKLTGLGVLLFLAFQAAARLVHFLMTGSFQSRAGVHGTPAFLRESHLTVPFIILISVVNPILLWRLFFAAFCM